MHCTCIIEFVCAISSCYNKQHGCELSPICCMLGYLTLLKTITQNFFLKSQIDSEDLIFWKEKKNRIMVLFTSILFQMYFIIL